MSRGKSRRSRHHCLLTLASLNPLSPCHTHCFLRVLPHCYMTHAVNLAAGRVPFSCLGAYPYLTFPFDFLV